MHQHWTLTIDDAISQNSNIKNIKSLGYTINETCVHFGLCDQSRNICLGSKDLKIFFNDNISF